MTTSDMFTLILSDINATIDELTFCRLLNKEQKRVRKFQRSMSKIGTILISKVSTLHIESTLGEIRHIIRHTEVWIEEGTTSTIKRNLSDLLSDMEKLEILVRFELENHGIVPRISKMIRFLASILLV